MYNNNVTGVLMFLDNLTDNDNITIENLISKERFNGVVIDARQWIIDSNNKFNNKGEFQVVF